MATLILRTSDETNFRVDLRFKRFSTLIQELQDIARDGLTIFLPGVRGPVLKKVVEWVNHHMDDPNVDEQFYLDHNFSKWDRQFIHVDNKLLYELYGAADYLGIRGLEILCRITLCKVLEGFDGDVDKIMEIFKLKEQDRSQATHFMKLMKKL